LRHRSPGSGVAPQTSFEHHINASKTWITSIPPFVR
jgi:hypothetical protein